MKKAAAFSGILLTATLLAAAYGILHDQVTYTICPEYFTKFKFIQFGLADEDLALRLADPRWQVATVGLLATAWFGALLGLVLGLVALIFGDARTMFRMGARSVLVTLLVAFLFGIAGFFYGRFYLSGKSVDWWLPEHLIHRTDFITVGSIHNFGYLGGLVGLVFGMIYLIWQRWAFRLAPKRSHPREPREPRTPRASPRAPRARRR
jgi:hypothetical protein